MAVVDSKITSFIDGTSFNPNRRPGQRISIQAQVLQQSDLEWYYSLTKLLPPLNGEAKAEDYLKCYRNASNYQRGIWNRSLRTLRIFIVDPGPFFNFAHAEYRRVISRRHEGRMEEWQRDAMRRYVRESAAWYMLNHAPNNRMLRVYSSLRRLTSVAIDSDLLDHP